MKRPENAVRKERAHTAKRTDPGRIERLRDEVKALEDEKQILLDWSKAITQVRARDDLLAFFSTKISRLLTFTHMGIALIDEPQHTITPFLSSGNDPIPPKPFSSENPLITQLLGADEAFLLKIDESTRATINTLLPKKSYHAATTSLLVTPFTRDGSVMAFLHLAADIPDSFTVAFQHIMNAVSPLLAAAVSNIIRNEEIKQKEWDKSFLLNFSNGIAAVRTKDELANVVYRSLKRLSQIKAYFIRTVSDDGVTLTPFLHDKDAYYLGSPLFKALLAKKITTTEGITARVMKGNIPVVIDFAEEIRRGTDDFYVEFWKHVGYNKPGFEQMVGTPLRAGERELGVLWVITNKINATLLEGICAQLSIAISNILANEEITRQQEEKSKLLVLSDEIARMRNRDDLLRLVSAKLKALFAIEEFGILKVDDDGRTYSDFMTDLGEAIVRDPDFEQISKAKYRVNDPVFRSIVASEEPVLLGVDRLAAEPDMPAYVGFWKHLGLRQILSIALRAGGATVGVAFIHIDRHEMLITKPNLLRAICSQLAVAVSNILANEKLLHYKQMLEIENDHLKEQIKTIYNFSEIIGSGEEMQEVYHLMSLVAHTNSTVLLLGETGTGKELIARAIHNTSTRKDKSMVKVNCAALPANLIESELFGHERGAFTGAVDRRIGKFELANDSTLFLDEIGEMPLETQVKLLRVIQEREFERVGGKTTIKVNVRIIAATNRNLEEEVNTGRFRSDLYYRLNVFPIVLPPLRNRLQDVEPLAQYFVARYTRSSGKDPMDLTPEVIHTLKQYTWPGNVRELEHLIERSVLLTEGPTIRDVPLPAVSKQGDEDTDGFPRGLQEMEASYIIRVLKRCNGRISGTGGAADILGIPATTLHSKMKKLGVSKAQYV